MPSRPGQLMSRASEIDFLLESGFTVTADDVTVEEFQALRVLHEERTKKLKEESRRGQKI